MADEHKLLGRYEGKSEDGTELYATFEAVPNTEFFRYSYGVIGFSPMRSNQLTLGQMKTKIGTLKHTGYIKVDTESLLTEGQRDESVGEFFDWLRGAN